MNFMIKTICAMLVMGSSFFMSVSAMETDMAEIMELGTGTVKWFNVEKGFGFIIWEDHDIDLYVPKSELIDEIDVGDKVFFQVCEGEKGPMACMVM